MYFVNFKLIILSLLFLARFEHLKAGDLLDEFTDTPPETPDFHKSNSVATRERARTISLDTPIQSLQKPFKTYQNDCRILFNSYRSNTLFCDEEEIKNALTSLIDEAFNAWGSTTIELLLNEVTSHDIEDEDKVITFTGWFEESKQALLSRK